MQRDADGIGGIGDNRVTIRLSGVKRTGMDLGDCPIRVEELASVIFRTGIGPDDMEGKTQPRYPPIRP